MPFQIIRNDITKVEADAIVNTANPEATYGRGTDSSIYHAAGAEDLLRERRKIGRIERGEAKATPAFRLNAKYIIHTVGPQWIDGKSGELETLRKCYSNSLKLAAHLGCESIAFPLIAAGVYGFPKDEALSIAMSEISSFLMKEDSDMEITLVVFDPTAFRLSRSLFMEIESFIDDEDVRRAHLQEYDMPGGSSEMLRRGQRNSRKLNTQLLFHEANAEASVFRPTSEFIFRDRLINMMNEKGIDNAAVYKGANVSKSAFSKIMCGDTKTPKKDAVMSFCISMKLNKAEAEDLMASAGWAFNPYDRRDRMIERLLLAGKNIYEVNEALFLADLSCLGY